MKKISISTINQKIKEGASEFVSECSKRYANKLEETAQTIYETREEKPVLLISGSEDPVGSYGKGVKEAFALYKKAGLTDIQMKLYKGDRHEALNELDREQVYQDLLEWLGSRMKSEEREA